MDQSNIFVGSRSQKSILIVGDVATDPGFIESLQDNPGTALLAGQGVVNSKDLKVQQFFADITVGKQSEVIIEKVNKEILPFTNVILYLNTDKKAGALGYKTIIQNLIDLSNEGILTKQAEVLIISAVDKVIADHKRTEADLDEETVSGMNIAAIMRDVGIYEWSIKTLTYKKGFPAGEILTAMTERILKSPSNDKVIDYLMIGARNVTAKSPDREGYCHAVNAKTAKLFDTITLDEY